MICLLGILISDIWFLTSVNAAMVVWNPSSFQQMVQMITNATKTLNEMKAMQNQMQQMKMLLGNPASLRQALNLGFIDQKSDAVGTLNQVNLDFHYERWGAVRRQLTSQNLSRYPPTKKFLYFLSSKVNQIKLVDVFSF